MNVEGQSTETIETPAVEQPQAVSIEDLQAKAAQLESTNARLLAESKDNADKYRSLRDKNSAREKIELEQSENWKERLELEKREKIEALEKYSSLKKTSLKKDLDFEVAKLTAGIPLNEGVSLDDIIYQVMDSGLIEVDESESGFNNVAEAFAKVKESKQFLFSSAKKPMVNAIPNGQAPAEKKLTNAELLNAAIRQVIKK